MTAQRRSWMVPNLCAKKRSSGRLAASGPSHPWTASLMYVLEVKDLLRQVRDCSHDDLSGVSVKHHVKKSLANFR